MSRRLPRSLLEFQRMFPNEDACSVFLWETRWPQGFVCPNCGSYDGRREPGRKMLWGCRGCDRQTSLIAGTIMENTKLPLHYWFWGAYLVASHSNGISAVQLQKQLQLGSYKTAWLMLNKLRRTMVDPARKKLSGMVEVDEAYIRFRSKKDPQDVNTQGRSPIGKIIIATAVEVQEFERKDGSFGTKPGRIRIESIPDTTRQTMHGFIRRNIEVGSDLVTDGSSVYRGLDDYQLSQLVHQPPEDTLLWTHRVIALVKRLGLGTYHGYRRRYIRRYLDEFVWRFNRRKARPATFHLILGLATKTPPAPLRKQILVDPLDRGAIRTASGGKVPKDALARLYARIAGRELHDPDED